MYYGRYQSQLEKRLVDLQEQLARKFPDVKN